MKAQEARDLLHALKETGKPPRHEDYYRLYTSGDAFKRPVRELEQDINRLGSKINGYSPRILVGGFGTGKTHFLRYLHQQLKKSIDNPERTLFTRIDLRDLERSGKSGSIYNFDYLFLTGLRTHEDGVIDGSYQNVLTVVYRRLADKVLENRKVNKVQQNVVIRKILEEILEITKEVVTELNPILFLSWLAAKQIYGRLRKEQRQRQEKWQEQQQVAREMGTPAQRANQRAFIDWLIDLGEGHITKEQFDSVARQISEQIRFGELIDLLMRLFRQAGYQRIVVFVDEMEHIQQPDEALVNERAAHAAEILNLFWRFHTRIAEQVGEVGGKAPSYPSVAQIMAMPLYLRDDVIKKLDRALYDLMSIMITFPLQVLGEQDEITRELVRHLCDLHEVAGYKLTNPLDLDNIKHPVFQWLIDEEMPATMRHVIPELIKEIQSKWIKPQPAI